MPKYATEKAMRPAASRVSAFTQPWMPSGTASVHGVSVAYCCTNCSFPATSCTYQVYVVGSYGGRPWDSVAVAVMVSPTCALALSSVSMLVKYPSLGAPSTCRDKYTGPVSPTQPRI